MKNYLLLFGIISIFILSACSQQVEQVPIETEPTVIEAVGDSGDDLEAPSQDSVQAETPAIGQGDVEEMIVESGSNLVEINMIAKRWSFEPATITVNEGDDVKLNIESVDVTHGFSIFEFGVNERLTPGKTTTVEFNADKAGEYTFFCTVPCGRGHSGMNGKLIVE